MAITIQNLRIQPFSQKNELKCVWGDTLTLTFSIPHVAGESYVCGIDNDRVVYPPSRPVCAYTNVFTRDGDDITFNLSLNTSKFRSYVSSIRKPMPVWLQVCRVGLDGKCETLVLDDILAIPSVLDATNTVCEGDPLKQLLDGKMDKPAAAGSEGQVLTMDADGHYAWADLPHIPEDPVQSDWDESDSSNLAYIKNKPELAAVATTGSYDDLVDKPHIPVDPVQADYDESDSTALDYIRNKPDLSVYSLVTETGNSIAMSIDDEYDLVVSLLDKAGHTLSTQDIDLPIESMIVDATYAAGVLTLTLQNGNTVDVDISDIVSGLVPDSRTVNGHALSADVTVTASDLGLATVATTGSYNDLTDKPVIPEQAQADWDESDSASPAYILNKGEVDGTVAGVDAFAGSLEAYFADPEKQPLTITIADPAGSNSISIYRTHPEGTFVYDYEYSRDGETWTAFTWADGAYRSNLVAIGSGADSDAIMIRGHNPFGTYNSCFNTSSQAAGDSVKVSGNLYSLIVKYGWWMIDDLGIYGTDQPYTPGGTNFNSIFFGLFYNYPTYREYYDFNCTDAQGLLLPADRLCTGCYYYLLAGTAITKAPVLPATHLASASYLGTFYRCPSLSDVTVGFTEWPASPTDISSPTRNWLSGVASTGVFRCPAALDTTIARGTSTIPANWTIETY